MLMPRFSSFSFDFEWSFKAANNPFGEDNRNFVLLAVLCAFIPALSVTALKNRKFITTEPS